ncbi:MAG: hypothetical protein LC650_02325 [Actinobacteria bacterium]|nr:hypothetical protein [Actinomycetota bacterium]
MNPKAMLASLFSNKRGMAMQHPLVLFIIGFFGVGFLGAVYVIVLAALGDTTTNADASGVINNTILLFTNFTAQFGTIGTVGGVLILLVLLGAAGIGAYAAYQRYGR